MKDFKNLYTLLEGTYWSLEKRSRFSILFLSSNWYFHVGANMDPIIIKGKRGFVFVTWQPMWLVLRLFVAIYLLTSGYSLVVSGTWLSLGVSHYSSTRNNYLMLMTTPRFSLVSWAIVMFYLLDPVGSWDSDILASVLGIGSKARQKYQGLEDHSSSFGALVEQSLSAFNGMAFRNGGRSLIGWLLPVIRGVVSGRYGNWYRVVCAFSYFIYRLHKTNGTSFVVRYLKASQVLLMQAVGSQRLKDSMPLGIRVKRSRAGFPLVIPALHRKAIKNGDVVTIRAWNTLFGLYRVFVIPGKLNTSTITEPGQDWSWLLESFWEFAMIFWQTIFNVRGNTGLKRPREKAKFNKIFGQTISFFPILTSNPITARLEQCRSEGEWEKLSVISTSWASITQSAKLLVSKEHAGTWQALCAFASLTGKNPWQARVRAAAKWPSDQFRIRPSKFGSSLGKLGLKHEAAGKVRVFALVDPWTQWLFYPLHKAMQYILRGIEQDGTFNQIAPAKILMEIAQRAAKKGRKPKLYSYDLSAATDRLPGQLQALVLSPLFGTGVGTNWLKGLVDRAYVLKEPDKGPKILKYAVGQPMGALSSWVMLAITHHFIVQYCYWSVYYKHGSKYKWFKNYAVLGDDVVIGDPYVADRYLKVMEEIGVGIGLAKSLVCRGNKAVMEFAKRLWVDGKDASMVPARDIVVARLSTSTASEFMLRHRFGLNSYLAMRGYGYRVRGSVAGKLWSLTKRLRVLLVLLSYPNGPLGKDTFIDWVYMDSLGSNRRITPTALESIYYYLQEYREKEIVPRVKRSEVTLLESKLAAPGSEDEGWDIIKPIPLGGPVRPGLHYSAFQGFEALNLEEPRNPSDELPEAKPVEKTDMFGEDLSLETEKELAQLYREGKVSAEFIMFAKKFREEGKTFNPDKVVDSYLSPEPIVKFGPKPDEHPTYFWANAVESLWNDIQTLEKEALPNRASFSVEMRVEEKSFTTFLPLYNKWVAIQRIISLDKWPTQLIIWTPESLAQVWERRAPLMIQRNLLYPSVPKFLAETSYFTPEPLADLTQQYIEELPLGFLRFWNWCASIDVRVTSCIIGIHSSYKRLIRFLEWHFFSIFVGLWIAPYVWSAFYTGQVDMMDEIPRGLETATSEGEPRDSEIISTQLVLLMVITVCAVLWAAFYLGGDSSSGPVTATVDSEPGNYLIPLRMPAEVGNALGETRLTRLPAIQAETALPLTSPIFQHGHWE